MCSNNYSDVDTYYVYEDEKGFEHKELIKTEVTTTYDDIQWTLPDEQIGNAIRWTDIEKVFDDGNGRITIETHHYKFLFVPKKDDYDRFCEDLKDPEKEIEWITLRAANETEKIDLLEDEDEVSGTDEENEGKEKEVVEEVKYKNRRYIICSLQ